MLKATALTLSIKQKTILRDVELDLAAGQFVAICGPNGAGKTSLLQCLAGLAKPSSGQITLAQQPIAEYSAAELADRRSWLAQKTDVSSPFNVQQILSLSGRIPTKEQIDSYGLSALLQRRYAELSGGEQQRTQILRTECQIAKTPACWLLDEPTASLDIAWQHKLLARMQRYSRQGHLVIAVLHDLQLAAQYADHCLLLGEQQIAAQGPISAVFTSERLSDLYQYPVQVLCNPRGEIQVTSKAYERT